MKVTSHIHAMKIPFKLQVSEGVTLDRFVYAYLIYGKKICLIDCGVASSEGIISDDLRKSGRSPEEVSLLILTHAHPDHIGGGRSLIGATRCTVASHKAVDRGCGSSVQRTAHHEFHFPGRGFL